MSRSKRRKQKGRGHFDCALFYSFDLMKRSIFIVVLGACVLRIVSASAQEPEKSAQSSNRRNKRKPEQDLLQKVLRVITDPRQSYEAKEAASDKASTLPSPLHNQVERAMLFQTDVAIAQEGFNGLFGDLTPQDLRCDNLKFVQKKIARIQSEVQSHIFHSFAPRVGVQTREDESLYYAMALEAIKHLVEDTQVLGQKESESLARACLMLSLSPCFHEEDKMLLLKASSRSRHFSQIALALSYRNLLSKGVLARLKSNSRNVSEENIVLQIVAAEVDESARKVLSQKIRTLAFKKYSVPLNGINLDPEEDATFINLLRFVNFPEKREMIVVASQSKTGAIKRAALLVAAEDFPDLVMNDPSLKNTFKVQWHDVSEYYSLLVYIALRHPLYVEQVQKMVGHSVFNERVKALRESSLGLEYSSSAGFNGL